MTSQPSLTATDLVTVVERSGDLLCVDQVRELLRLVGVAVWVGHSVPQCHAH